MPAAYLETDCLYPGLYTNIFICYLTPCIVTPPSFLLKRLWERQRVCLPTTCRFLGRAGLGSLWAAAGCACGRSGRKIDLGVPYGKTDVERKNVVKELCCSSHFMSPGVISVIVFKTV